MHVLDQRPGQGQAVVGAGAAADLVQDHQGPRGGVVQDVRDLDHLDHERRCAAADIVAGSDPGEDAIGDAHVGGLGGDPRPDLGQQSDQRGLADVGRLTGHVWAREDRDAAAGVGGRVQGAVVRHERLAGRGLFDDRVATLDDAQAVVVRDGRRAVAHLGGDLGQARQHIQFGQAPGRVQDAADLSRHAIAQLAEEVVLQVAAELFRLQDLRLELLELGRDVALAGLDRLLADVAVGHAIHLAAGHLQEVAEDRVVADAQTGDARELALAGLELGHGLLAAAGDLAQLVQLGVETVAHQAPLFDGHGRRVHNRVADLRGHVFEGVEALLELAQDGRAHRGQLQLDRGHHGQGRGQGNQIAAGGATRGELRDQALDVEHVP